MKFFKPEEFACKCCGVSKMDPSFLRDLETLREVCDFPFIVSSGYRCPKHNAKVSSTGTKGPHTTGKAVDIRCSGERAYNLVLTAMNLGFTGIGVSQKGPHEKRFIHVDTCHKAKTLWTY